LPYIFTSNYSGNVKTQNYRAGQLIWTGTAWLLPLDGGLYRTTDATGLTGWSAVAWAAGSVEYPPQRIAQAGTSLIASVQPWSGAPSGRTFERSTDDGVTWATVWARSGAGLPDYLILTEPLAIDGEFVAYTGNGQYRLITSTSSGATWSVSANSNANDFFSSGEKFSDGANILGVSIQYGHEFIYSTNGTSYSDSTVI